jgi:hypothetical protein
MFTTPTVIEPPNTMLSVVTGPSADQSSGGTACTMLLHFGQAMICPIAEGSTILSRARQVGQTMRKGFTASSF